MSMSNESSPQVPAEPSRSALPQFEPGRPAAVDDTQQLPSSAPTSAMPVTPPATPYAYAALPSAASPIAGPGVPLSPTGLPTRERASAAVAADGPRWTAKKTAVTAGLALVLASAGAIGAAAAMPAGSTGDDSGFRGPGGGRNFQFPGGQRGLQNQQNQQGLQNQPNQQGTSPQQLPNLQNGLSGGGLSGIDPNQLSQLDPQDLLQQLGQDTQGSQDDQGTDPGPDGQDDSGPGTSGGTRTT
jgi:hypothetical protein